MPENGLEKNTSHFKNGTIFKRWQQSPFCKSYSKTKWSQMIYNWTELQNTKDIYRSYPFNHWPFCKGHSKAKWSKKIYFEWELLKSQNIQKMTPITLQLF